MSVALAVIHDKALFFGSPVTVILSVKTTMPSGFDGDMHALSVHPSCTKFSLSGDEVFLRPNPAFMPKVWLPLGLYLRESLCRTCAAASWASPHTFV